jgi:hypothetical protein
MQAFSEAYMLRPLPVEKLEQRFRGLLEPQRGGVVAAHRGVVQIGRIAAQMCA